MSAAAGGFTVQAAHAAPLPAWRLDRMGLLRRLRLRLRLRRWRALQHALRQALALTGPVWHPGRLWHSQQQARRGADGFSTVQGRGSTYRVFSLQTPPPGDPRQRGALCLRIQDSRPGTAQGRARTCFRPLLPHALRCDRSHRRRPWRHAGARAQPAPGGLSVEVRRPQVAG